MLEIPLNLLPYQRAAVDCESRFTWNCWARQTGKSHTFSLRRLIRGLRRRRNQIILSAGERQSREVMLKVWSHCRVLGLAADLRDGPLIPDARLRRLEVQLPDGVRIIGLPANPMTARGFTGDVFLDEFAMHRDDAGIWAALFPTLLRGGGELDVASTPMGCANMFHRLQANPRFERSTIPLETAVAQGLDVDIAALRDAMNDEQAWRQEFCCEFVDEATAFMTYELIRACQDAALATSIDWRRLDQRHAEIYVGIDVGRLRDVTAVWLWERLPLSEFSPCQAPIQFPPCKGRASDHPPCQGGAGGGVGRGSKEGGFITRGLVILQNAPFSEQESLIARLLDRRAVRRCCIDAGGIGLHLAERLTDRFGDHRVEAVTFTAALKHELAGRLRIAAERGMIRIPVDDHIVADWHAVTRTTTGAGAIRFDARRDANGHADRFWAAALGLHAASEALGPAEIQTDRGLRFARQGVW